MDQNKSLLAFANPARKYTPAAGGKRKVNKTKILNKSDFMSLSFFGKKTYFLFLNFKRKYRKNDT